MGAGTPTWRLPAELTEFIGRRSELAQVRAALEGARLVARGQSNIQIASELVISVRTAETHVQHIMDKLGCSSRAQIAAWSAARPPR